MHGVIPVVPICLDLSIDLGGDDQQASRQGVVVFASPSSSVSLTRRNGGSVARTSGQISRRSGALELDTSA